MLKFLKCFLLLLIFFITSCSKDKPKQTPPSPAITPSSDKEITRFAFEKSINSSFLDTTINGVIDGDTIRLIVPAETDLSNLKPSITIKGLSVTPNSNIAQNFTSSVDFTVKAEDGTSKKYTTIIKYRSTVFIASTNGSLYALDAKTGDIIWKTTPLRAPFSAYSGPSSSPAVGSGLVFISDYKGVYAYDVKNGTLKWTIPINPNINGVELDPTPLYANGILYIGTKEGSVLAVDAPTGNIKWKFNHPSSVPFTSPPTLFNNTLFIGCMDFGLYALDANTGTIKWKFPTGAWVVSNPLFFNNNLYIKSDNFYAINPLTGSLIWKMQATGNLSSWAGMNNVLYDNLSNHLYAYDGVTGNLLWYFTAPSTGLSYNQRSSPIIVGDRIFMGSIDGNVYAFSINNRNKAWQAATGNMIYSSPVVVDGVLYIGSFDGKVYAFETTFGELKWSRSTDLPIYSSPCVISEKGIKYYPGISGSQQ